MLLAAFNISLAGQPRCSRFSNNEQFLSRRSRALSSAVEYHILFGVTAAEKRMPSPLSPVPVESYLQEITHHPKGIADNADPRIGRIRPYDRHLPDLETHFIG